MSMAFVEEMRATAEGQVLYLAVSGLEVRALARVGAAKTEAGLLVQESQLIVFDTC